MPGKEVLTQEVGLIAAVGPTAEEENTYPGTTEVIKLAPSPRHFDEGVVHDRAGSTSPRPQPPSPSTPPKTPLVRTRSVDWRLRRRGPPFLKFEFLSLERAPTVAAAPPIVPGNSRWSSYHPKSRLAYDPSRRRL
ncbi:hypothetical protein chiPu_0021011 [Chiloscyllium punctatum]|uniref:Uncharacterized protein n=1 Tax=Chiloscyllium punctatum TaxID=137246 RepID=A0A401RM25_CHIPU|nr:hypothetical protein [Chiloscyllium punctatum]